MHIYYRARSENIGKKAGNIADWVERFGGAYEFFIILDADSVMSGALVVQLAALMGRNPRTALIQTVPRLVGANTLFARLQQFAVAFYGPVIAAGFAAWHQESGNYWGHNAILRTRAFAQSAGLPTLPGTPPLGGHIQSHDFVEAAFLRRAGWQVCMLPDLQGSYEGCPPTLIDVAVRDRRWAQGNFQHLRIVRASGLPWVSRLHLAMGTYTLPRVGTVGSVSCGRRCSFCPERLYAASLFSRREDPVSGLAGDRSDQGLVPVPGHRCGCLAAQGPWRRVRSYSS